jgi:hypothetical protein
MLRELEEPQRAFDVDFMRSDWREFGARRQERRQVKDKIDLELREHPLENPFVGDRPGELPTNLSRQRWFERRDVDRYDRTAYPGELID